MVPQQPANIQMHNHCLLLQDLVDSDTASTELKQRIAAAQKRKQQQQQEKTGLAEVLLSFGATKTHVHRNFSFPTDHSSIAGCRAFCRKQS